MYTAPLNPGLYVVSRWVPEKWVTHVAVLVRGSTYAQRLGRVEPELVVEFDEKGLHAAAPISSQGWEVVRRILDTDGALARIRESAKAPVRPYDLFVNNCEHFVSSVESGQRTSPQVVGFLTVCGALFLLLGTAYLLPKVAKA